MIDTTQRRADGGRRRLMDYIPNKDLFRAVMLARWLVRERMVRPYYAALRAADRYGVSRRQVHRYLSQAGGTVAGRRRKKGIRHQN